MTAWPACYYGDPLNTLIAKENAFENKIKGCHGCRYLSLDTIGRDKFATCQRGLKVGQKGKCSQWKESE